MFQAEAKSSNQKSQGLAERLPTAPAMMGERYRMFIGCSYAAGPSSLQRSRPVRERGKEAA